MSRRLSTYPRSDATTPGRKVRGSVSGAKFHFAKSGSGQIADPGGALEITSLGERSNEMAKKVYRMENTYKLKPDDDKVFRVCDVEKLAESVLAQHLAKVEYDPARCRDVSQTVAVDILERVKEMGFKRYKIIANVSIGSLREKPGMQFGSRCLWNKNTDNFVSVKYSNSSIFAVAMIYGLYFE
ncbi:dynein light chain Tctex-type 5-like [Crassostrea virginica]|uniref:Tctex1 domain-containing protein 1-like n=1 Tax=Crassostrea virginica TaxID=6565 RepID=A0A8B8BNH8_CRAVI|nr:tctex1 domain-containing protein 1-like [Crassostrea virginica]